MGRHHNINVKYIDRRVLFCLQSVREIQNSLRDGVILLRALLDELKRNVESERDGIHSMYTTLQENIKKQCDLLLQDLER